MTNAAAQIVNQELVSAQEDLERLNMAYIERSIEIESRIQRLRKLSIIANPMQPEIEDRELPDLY